MGSRSPWNSGRGPARLSGAVRLELDSLVARLRNVTAGFLRARLFHLIPPPQLSARMQLAIVSPVPIAFDLNAQGLASYRWGSLYAHFTWVATPTTDLLKKVLVALATGEATWSNAIEFRATLSLLHEFVHYIQDVSTGVGHWDYLVRREEVPKALTAGRNASRHLVDRAISAEIARQSSVMRGRLLFLPARDVPAARLARAVTRMESLHPGIHVSADEATDFSLESMLEAEAALTTLSEVFALKMTDAQLDTLKSNSSAVDLRSMGRAYYGPFDNFVALLELSGHRGVDALHAVSPVLSLFVDVACAHPSPQLLRRRGLDPTDCEPGVKLARLMRAMHEADARTGEEMSRWFKTFDDSKAEQALLRMCPVPYPTSCEVYEDWRHVLSAIDAEHDETVKLRLISCERRIAARKSVSSKRIGDLFNCGLPFLCHTGAKKGLASVHLNWRGSLDPGAEGRLFADVLRGARDVRLWEHIAEASPYTCPLAERGLCEAAEPACGDGLNSLDLLPSIEGCSVRRALTEVGWRLKEE